MSGIIAISGVSGAGKTTLQRRLMRQLAAGRVASNTTREPRSSDEDGEYNYCLPSEFDGSRDWLWVVTIHGHKYGTRRSDIMSRLRLYPWAVMVIVHTCHAPLQQAFANTSVRLKHFHIRSPGEMELWRRLLARRDAPDTIRRRIENERGWDDTVARELSFVQSIGPGDIESVCLECVGAIWSA